MSSTTILLHAEHGEDNSLILQKLALVDITTKAVPSLPHLQQELLANLYPVVLFRCDSLGRRFFDLVEFISEHRIQTQVILNPRTGTVEDAVRALKAGASDYIPSDGYDARVVESILRTVSQSSSQASFYPHPKHPSEMDDQPILIGKSSAICEIRSVINLVAKSETAVLVTGESGTGKEVVAHLIHLQSNRRDHPFYALNCASLPKDVIENELFGHEKGAFTGALPKKTGSFEQANNGTLFLDEIAEMGVEVQAKLLRAIETQRFRRLGGKEEIAVDVRIIAATNKNIVKALQSKELREDLYYRLSVIELYIPPLRERKEDVFPIADHFLQMFAEKYAKPDVHFSDDCRRCLDQYDWPGNVRELKNIVERAVVMCPNDLITTDHLPTRLHKDIRPTTSVSIPLGCSTHEAEKILILQTLASAGNNKAKAARILGMSRKTLHNKLHAFSRD